jgi:thiamine biosynthesis lipoprotein
MDYRKKNILYTILLLVSVFAVWLYRKNQSPNPIFIEGNTMGTTYHITYFDSRGRNFKTSVDSVLLLVNKSINTYDSASEVSMFNKSARGTRVALPYLLPSLKKSAEIFKSSNGAFDPTVMPLVNAWGFGPGKKMKMDSTRVDSLKAFIGFEKVLLREDSVLKSDPRTQLDFGGIGQGYGADVVTNFLRSKGIENMLVELGGEGMACGINLKSKNPWSIGILDPGSTRENQFFIAYASLQDRSFTTSGNYFNYKIENGKKFSHTIDPISGFPIQRELLSASVFANDATTADGWATAFMVMGHERAIEILKTQTNIEAFLIFSTPDGKTETYCTDNMKPHIQLK